jgi:ribose/xylose/arabinose/galactoside ABC-type transport system permease subunit
VTAAQRGLAHAWTSWLLARAPVVALVVVVAVFGALAPRFLTVANAVNIVVHAASLGIVASGMTFVLLAAGIDLSVGSVMFLAAIAAGKVVLGGGGLATAMAAGLGIALLGGVLNAILIVRLRLLAFVVTLATLYVGRGLGLMWTETRAMNLPDTLLALGAAKVLFVPLPIVVLLLSVALAQLVLSRTVFGRQLYAVGHDPDAAVRAGIPVAMVLVTAYLISAFAAGLGGLVAVAQLGAVSPTFGQQRELAAVAAAVLGGSSLFGGRGQVWPGTIVGALLMQTVESGLVIAGADPYLYPIVSGAVIFAAVALDALRRRSQAGGTPRLSAKP